MQFERQSSASTSAQAAVTSNQDAIGKRSLVDDLPAVQRSATGEVHAPQGIVTDGTAAPASHGASILDVVGRNDAAPVQRMLSSTAAASSSASAAPVATGTQTDVQDHLTEAHWKTELTGRDAKAPQRAVDPKYWDKYTAAEKQAAKKAKQPAKTPPRRIDEIMKTVGPDLIARIQAEGVNNPGQLKIYRTMTAGEAEGIMQWYSGKKGETEGLLGDSGLSNAELSAKLKSSDDPGIMPIAGHLGDETQALSYKTTENRMLEFTLKPGAHKALFDPEYMAVARAGKSTRVLAENEKLKTGKTFPAGSGAEGNLPGYVGLKSEDRGDFSLTMGESEATHLLFQLMIDTIQVV